jgi:hypothetical protein
MTATQNDLMDSLVAAENGAYAARTTILRGLDRANMTLLDLEGLCGCSPSSSLDAFHERAAEANALHTAAVKALDEAVAAIARMTKAAAELAAIAGVA